MANPTPPPPRPRHSKLVRIIAIVLLALIVLVGLAVLITWLVIKPKKLVYTVEEGSIHGFNLTNNNNLNATFNFVLRSYNPNSKVSIYYDKIETSVTYDDQTVGRTTVDPFFQPRRNVTTLRLKLESQGTSLFWSVAKDLKLERSSGEIELEVRVKAKIRFKVGVWKSRKRTMRILCSPVVVHFSSSKGFQRTPCDIDL